MAKKALLALLMALITASGCGNSNNAHEHGHENHENAKKSATHEGAHHEGHGAKKVSTQIDWKFAKEPPASNETTELTIQVNDESGKPVQAFDIEHEKRMHLIVVSDNLSYFAHLHPEYKGNGQFADTVTFPSGGNYHLYADYVPKGAAKTVKQHTVTVQGEKATTTPLQPDETLTKTVDGKEITLSFDELKAGREATLTFYLKDEKTDKPITNLQPYLGAIGHVVIIREQTYDYLHVHPIDEQGKGPEAAFMVEFPKSGLYQIWAQFQHDGRVITVPFTVKVS